MSIDFLSKTLKGHFYVLLGYQSSAKVCDVIELVWGTRTVSPEETTALVVVGKAMDVKTGCEVKLDWKECGCEMCCSPGCVSVRSTSEVEYEVESVLGHKFSGKCVFYLVKWKGYDDENNSWEPAINLKHSQEVVQEYLV